MLFQMAEFMDNDIIDNPMRCHDDSPVEFNITMDGASTPSRLIVFYRN